MATVGHFGGELRRFGREDGEERLEVVSPYEPAGDQPQAIAKLAQGVQDGLRYQTLMGVTGSGKTFTYSLIMTIFYSSYNLFH